MAALTEAKVPDIGDFTDIPVIELLVAVGDAVEVESPLVELESDKATFEVPSAVAGVVKEIKVAVGDKVSEGSVLVLIEEGGSADAPAEGDAPAAEAAEAPAVEAADAKPEARASAAVEETPAAKAETPAATGDSSSNGDASPIFASPTVRRLAREEGIDLQALAGSGRLGRITKDDLSRPAAPAGGGDGGLGLAPWPVVNFEKLGPVTREPLSKIGKLSAANLARNWVRIPHVTHNDDADITELEAFRKQLNSEQQDVKVTMVALLLKASIASLKAFPKFNSSLDGDELVLKQYYNVGFAADTPNGLVVPVVKDVDKKGLLELASEVTELSGKARAGKLMPAQMSGGNFSISSLGGIGGTSFTPIVNAPEVAILGVVRSATKPVWDGKAFQPRLILPLSLSYDHRVIDGAAAARFTAHLAATLKDLRRVLL